MSRRSMKAQAAEIFNKLQCTGGYRDGFASQKLQIIRCLLKNKQRLITFAETPECQPYQINGFFMEQCAQFSNQLPKNTSKAQYISERIIAHLKKRSFCHPDYIWLTIHNKRITITALGEVKSHPASIRYRPDQLAHQEDNIQSLVTNGDMVHIVPPHYRIVLADAFTRYLVLPRSIGAPYWLPESTPLGWEIKEIEFTFLEILTLKDLLLTNNVSQQQSQQSQDRFAYATSEYQMLAREVMSMSEYVIKKFLDNILPTESIKNLLIWSILWNSMPTNTESINQVLQWFQTVKQWGLCLTTLFAQSPCALVPLHNEELLSAEMINRHISTDDALFAHAFLSRLQEIRHILPPPPELSKKQEINIFRLL